MDIEFSSLEVTVALKLIYKFSLVLVNVLIGFYTEFDKHVP